MTTEQLKAADRKAHKAYRRYKAANKEVWKLFHKLNMATAWGEPTEELTTQHAVAVKLRDSKLRAWKKAVKLLR